MFKKYIVSLYYMCLISLNNIIYADPKINETKITSSMNPLIHLLQVLALPAGITMALWGVLEYIMSKGDGREKIKKAFIGYILVFIIPLIFYTIHDAFGGK